MHATSQKPWVVEVHESHCHTVTCLPSFPGSPRFSVLQACSQAMGGAWEQGYDVHIKVQKQWRKKILRSSQDSNLGLLYSSQMLLPTEPWSYGIGAGDRWHLSTDTVHLSGWIFLMYD